MNKDFCNTEVVLIWARLEAAWPHPCGYPSAFQFGTGQTREHQRLVTPGKETGGAHGSKKPSKVCNADTASPAPNAFCTDLLLRPSLPADAHTGCGCGILLELGSAALMQSHGRCWS